MATDKKKLGYTLADRCKAEEEKLRNELAKQLREDMKRYCTYAQIICNMCPTIHVLTLTLSVKPLLKPQLMLRTFSYKIKCGYPSN